MKLRASTATRADVHYALLRDTGYIFLTNYVISQEIGKPSAEIASLNEASYLTNKTGHT
jgi:hypothetical protein